MIGFEAVVIVLAATLATMAILVSIYALHQVFTTRIELRAMQQSTHSVQMVPVDSVVTAEDDAAEREVNENVHRHEHDGYDGLADKAARDLHI